MAVIATAAATPALAFWTGTGSGSALALTATLAPPTAVTAPVAAVPDVPVSWTASAGVIPAGYFVTRYDGTTTAAACGTGPTSLILTTSCTDSAVSEGTFTYLVTAVYRSWTARSLPSGPVTVENAVAVTFLAQPTDTTVNTPVTPAVTVTLRTAGGERSQRAGITVTIAIVVNPVGGVLAGVTTAVTDAFGVATFNNLSISKSGVGYVLTATSPGLTSDASAPFTVSPPPTLGAAQSFSVLAGTAVVNVGAATTVSGDVGVSTGVSITGFPAGSVGGDSHVNDAAAVAAQAALLAANDTLTALPPTRAIGGDLNGLTFLPGVYYSGAALALTGTVTLDGGGDTNAVFVFQINAAFDTAAASAVVLTNGARAANVYWVALGAAGTGAGAALSGSILAKGAITLGAGTVLIGRALSRDAVTLASSTVRFTLAVPPTISITGGSAAFTKDTAPIIAGTSSAPPSSPVTVSVAGQVLSTAVTGSGAWTVTAATLAAGTFAVVARVRDAAGNGAAATQQLTVEVNPAPVNLQTARAFAVLAATSIVSTGATVLDGDLGESPGVVVDGFPPGVVNGAMHVDNPTAAAAQVDLLTVINELAARTPHTQITGNLAGRTFHLGIHHQTAAMALTGTVTLDAEGNPDAIFVFQTDAAFDTAASSSVVLANGAQAANVYWVVAGAAGTGATSSMSGTILARGAITLGAGTVLAGRALSRGAVTLAGNPITVPVLAGFARMRAVLHSADDSASPGTTDQTPLPPTDPATVTVSSSETTPAPPGTTPPPPGTTSQSAVLTAETTPDVTPESTQSAAEATPETTPLADPCAQATTETPPPTSPAALPPTETTPDVTPTSTPPSACARTMLVSSAPITSTEQALDHPETLPESSPESPPAPTSGIPSASTAVATP
ncbi:ice-binding family protein [Nakamurella sp. GG22]